MGGVGVIIISGIGVILGATGDCPTNRKRKQRRGRSLDVGCQQRVDSCYAGRVHWLAALQAAGRLAA